MTLVIPADRIAIPRFQATTYGSENIHKQRHNTISLASEQRTEFYVKFYFYGGEKKQNNRIRTREKTWNPDVSSQKNMNTYAGMSGMCR